MNGNGIPGWVKGLGVALVFLTMAGGFFGLVHGMFFKWSTEAVDSQWSWWHYALALPVIGLLGILGDAVGEAIGSIIGAPIADAWRRVPRWLQVCIVVAGPLLVIGGAFWLAGAGGGYDPTAMTVKN